MTSPAMCLPLGTTLLNGAVVLKNFPSGSSADAPGFTMVIG